VILPKTNRLVKILPELERTLRTGGLPPPLFGASAIKCEFQQVKMRDGILLATDIYMPPVLAAPVIAFRTPYVRDMEDFGYVASLMCLARRGYIVVAQDCRGTGGSEPDHWDYYMFESEDSFDLVEWITKQRWFDGFIGSFGQSYVGQTQWCMATHPAMSTFVPGVSGLGVAVNTAHLHMFLNAYARSVGKGEENIVVHLTDMERMFEKETMAGGYFSEPLHMPFSEQLLAAFPQLRSLSPSAANKWLWKTYSLMPSAQRAAFVKQALGVSRVTSMHVESLSAIFGHRISHDRHTLPHENTAEMCRSIKAPPLLRTGWYDWGLNDALATWELFRREAHPEIAARARMIITPYAHNMPGYRQGVDVHPELLRPPNFVDQVGTLVRWYQAVREGTTDQWPTIIYYLMGANEWRVAKDWPVPGAELRAFYLREGEALSTEPPRQFTRPDEYIYDPQDPTPTVGGSIVSFVYTTGSVDVSAVQARKDLRVYTSPPFDQDLDVVGALRLILYASSSAMDTDFVGRVSDVFPDGRAITLQNGILRARYRNMDGDPEFLEPGRIYRFEIDLWSTANRFKTGHRLRLDISSADFPRFDRNSNSVGLREGVPVVARQAIYHDSEHPSCLLLSVIGDVEDPR